MGQPVRCWPTSDPLYVVYHDEEWGRPVRDERGLYERLCLQIGSNRRTFRTRIFGYPEDNPSAVPRVGCPP